MKQIVAGVAIALGLATSASALTFTESSDFSNVGVITLPSLGTLDTGLNEVSGTLNGSCDSAGEICFGGPDRQDSFVVTVGAGTQLTDVNIVTEGGGPLGLTYGSNLRGPDSLVVADNGVAPLNSPTNYNGLTLGPGDYLFSIFSLNSDETGSFDFFWRASFSVESTMSPVPLPAGAPLLLAGLGALAIARRRGKAKRA